MVKKAGEQAQSTEKPNMQKRANLDDSDDEATNKMQMIMNCVYLGMFFVIGGIFVWQFYLA